MAELPHLLFKNPVEGVTKWRYNRRMPGNQEDKEVQEPDFTEKANVFRQALRRFNLQLEQRNINLDFTLKVPSHIRYIEINFIGPFNTFYENYYRENFGLVPVKYFHYNRTCLFAIVDYNRFDHLLSQIRLFQKAVRAGESTDELEKKIRFFISFNLLTTDKILERYLPEVSSFNLQLIDNAEIYDSTTSILTALERYLQERDIAYQLNVKGLTLELFGVTDSDVLTEIANNFDVLSGIRPNSGGVIGPSKFGTAMRDFPFSISNSEEELPIVGIIDTGISIQTPLSSITVNSDNTYHISDGDPRVDTAQDGYGHGTAVGAFAALGTPIASGIEGEVEADAKLLSIKVLDGNQGILSSQAVLNLIRTARRTLGVKLFVLTLGYEQHLRFDDTITEYAYQLDLLAYEEDVLIFIACGNNKVTKQNHENYPNHFAEEESNFYAPAESMNNITIGAIGKNFEMDQGVTPEDFPTLYTSTHFIDVTQLKLVNSKLVKPDVLFYGGNFMELFDKWGSILDDTCEAGIQCLSAREGYFFSRAAGTSYATPLVANIAAKLARIYPTLRLQTIKALIINSCQGINMKLLPECNLSASQQRYLTGHGIPDIAKCIFSNENEVSILLEDEVTIDQIQVYTIQVPEYLAKAYKKNGVLRITATLCFSFPPVFTNQLAYCPIHISFAILKNIEVDNISGSSKQDIHIKNAAPGWTQDAPYKWKLLSNSQKITFLIDKQNLIDNENTFKIAINSHYHKLLLEKDTIVLPTVTPFSLVVNLEENFKLTEQTGSLYAELQAINRLEIIGEVELEADL